MTRRILLSVILILTLSPVFAQFRQVDYRYTTSKPKIWGTADGAKDSILKLDTKKSNTVTIKIK